MYVKYKKKNVRTIYNLLCINVVKYVKCNKICKLLSFMSIEVNVLLL